MCFRVQGQFIGLMICEDVWHSDIVQTTKEAGAEILLALNASPFHAGKAQQREVLICSNAKSTQLPIVYVNAVGGQDELVFDGASFVTNSEGEIVFVPTNLLSNTP